MEHLFQWPLPQTNPMMNLPISLRLHTSRAISGLLEAFVIQQKLLLVKTFQPVFENSLNVRTNNQTHMCDIR